MMELIESLKMFGHQKFRPLQQETIETLLKGEDCLTILPTGGGKSLTYQIPAILLNGLTIVISPLIALMKDQVDALNKKGIAATYIGNDLEETERSKRLRLAYQGKLKLLYIAPERLKSVEALAEQTSLVVIDEAHCVSQWGHDFRPEYRSITENLTHFNCPRLAVTATATPRVRKEIAETLLRERHRKLIGSFVRENLTWSVHWIQSDGEKVETIRLLRQAHPGPCIIYCATRKKTEQVALALGAQAYHAGLPDQQRHQTQDDFLSGKINLVCATVAFGMGVDKPDVRLVAHFQVPGTLEAYYQEAGRAGRDQQPAHSALLVSTQDFMTRRAFIGKTYPDEAGIQRIHRAVVGGSQSVEAISQTTGFESTPINVALGVLVEHQWVEKTSDGWWQGFNAKGHLDLRAMQSRRQNDFNNLNRVEGYAKQKRCRSQFMLSYFGEQSQACGRCDCCQPSMALVGKVEKSDDLAQIVSQFIARRPGCKVDQITKILTGSTSANIINEKSDPEYGKLNIYSQLEIKAVLDQLLAKGTAIKIKYGIYLKEEGAVAIPDIEDMVAAPIVEKTMGNTIALPVTIEENHSITQEENGNISKESYNNSIEEIILDTPVATAPKEAPARMAKPAVRQAVNASEEDGLLDKLMAWRGEKATSLKVAAHIILSNATIEEIAQTKPADIEALGKIKGIGPGKIQQFGQEIVLLSGREKQKKAISNDENPGSKVSPEVYQILVLLETIEQGGDVESKTLLALMDFCPEEKLPAFIEGLGLANAPIEKIQGYMNHHNELVIIAAMKAVRWINPGTNFDKLLNHKSTQVQVMAIRFSGHHGEISKKIDSAIAEVRIAALIRLKLFGKHAVL
jgi:ATP-dependent DNA helicase RecQ